MMGTATLTALTASGVFPAADGRAARDIIDDVASYLEAASELFTVGVNLTKGFMPENPSTVTTIYETGGFSPIHFFSTGETRAFERPGLMIHSRSTDYRTARTLCREAWRLLDGVHDQPLPTSTGTHYVSIDSVQSPFNMGRDKNERELFSVNFNVTKSTG